MSSLIGRNLLGAVAAACLFVSGAAQGVIYRGSYDPIEFMGIADFDVDPACIQSDGWVAVPTCGTVTLLSALVTNSPAPPVTDSIAFNPPFDPLGGGVFGLLWAGGELIGVDMSRTGTSGSPLTGLVFSFSGGYALEFVTGQAPSYDPEFGPPVGVNLYECGDGCGSGELQGTALDVTFQVIPEPASVGLVLGALGAGWLTRRRKAKS